MCLAEGPFLGEIGETGSISKPLRSFGTDSLRTEVHPEGRFAYTGLRKQWAQQGWGMIGYICIYIYIITYIYIYTYVYMYMMIYDRM